MHKDTLIVLCYALFCVCFGLIVASLVGVLDKRRNKKKKFSAGVEATEVSIFPVVRPVLTFLTLSDRLRWCVHN